MKDNEANEPEAQAQHKTLSLDHERRGLRTMKLLLGIFSAILILALVLSMIPNR